MTNEKQIEKAKKTLRDCGYYVDNLWHIDDVKRIRDCTDKEAYVILDRVMTSETLSETIFVDIDEYILD